MQQQTIATSFSLAGTGLHHGKVTTLVFSPAPADTGIVFERCDLPGRPRVPADIHHIQSQPFRCTCLKAGTAEVYTVEHLLATCYALGIDNLVAAVDGPEMPGMDGSALPIYRAFKEVGIKRQEAAAKEFAVAEPMEVEDDTAGVYAVPCENLEIEYLLDYGVPSLPRQSFSTAINEANFARDIAPARTFVLKREAEQLRKMGMGKGATMQNTLVIDDGGGVIENTLRFPDEFARHKILDLLGDLALLGKKIRARISGVRSGHTINARFVQKIAAAAGQN